MEQNRQTVLTKYHHIRSLQVEGYRSFRELKAQFSEMEVIVGASGSGKSSLFEFLRFLRDSVYQDIPPEIVNGAAGQQVFHCPGNDRFEWELEIELLAHDPLCYQGAISGPIGRTCVCYEKIRNFQPAKAEEKKGRVFLEVRNGQGTVQDPNQGEEQLPQEIGMRRPNQLALSLMTNPAYATAYALRDFISGWRFYGAFNIDTNRIRRPVPTQQDPMLAEDGSNLSAVLFFLMTEHRLLFDELKAHLRSAIPAFRNLTVKARGGPGEVIACWNENGVDDELTLADLSEGILRYLIWLTLCLLPDPPSLICVDQPDLGLHPRTLPILAALFEKASSRTQVLLITHSSYFLTHFDVSHIAVMKRVTTASEFFKPQNSKILQANLVDFGVAEMESMHRNNELEVLT